MTRMPISISKNVKPTIRIAPPSAFRWPRRVLTSPPDPWSAVSTRCSIGKGGDSSGEFAISFSGTIFSPGVEQRQENAAGENQRQQKRHDFGAGGVDQGCCQNHHQRYHGSQKTAAPGGNVGGVPEFRIGLHVRRAKAIP